MSLLCLSECGVIVFNKRNIMQRNTKGQFKKGMIPWNKGKRGYMGANRTSFTSERVAKERTKYNIGVPHKPDEVGYLVCRIEEKKPHKDSRTGKIYMHRKRISYAKYLLQQQGITIPKGYVVYHLDQDNSNNNLDNLKVISRAELIALNLQRRKI